MASQIHYHRYWYTNPDNVFSNGLNEEKIGVAYSPGAQHPDRRWFDVVSGQVSGSNNKDNPVLVAALNDVLADLRRYRERALELAKMLPAGRTPEYNAKLAVMNEGLGQIIDRLDRVGAKAAVTPDFARSADALMKNWPDASGELTLANRSPAKKSLSPGMTI